MNENVRVTEFIYFIKFWIPNNLDANNSLIYYLYYINLLTNKVYLDHQLIYQIITCI